jgi:hypothetical protein
MDYSRQDMGRKKYIWYLIWLASLELNFAASVLRICSPPHSVVLSMHGRFLREQTQRQRSELLITLILWLIQALDDYAKTCYGTHSSCIIATGHVIAIIS